MGNRNTAGGALSAASLTLTVRAEASGGSETVIWKGDRDCSLHALIYRPSAGLTWGCWKLSGS